LTDVFNRELSDSEIEVWISVMSEISDSALSYAVDNWLRNGRFFPTPADITGLANAYATHTASTLRCDAECRRCHGRGYHTNDLMWLWKKRQSSAKKQWSSADYEAAMTELDSKREAGKPAWRTA